MRALAVLLAAASAAAGELPPVTESFRKTALLELTAVLGDYPWRHGAEVTTVGFAPDGKLFATIGGDRKIRLYRGDGAELRTFGPARGRTFAAVFTPDGATLATASSSGNVALWDTATGGQKALLAHGAAVTYAAFLSDGVRLATAARDRTVKVWDTASGGLLSTASFAADADAGGPGPAIVGLGVDPRSGVVVAFSDGTVVTVDPRTGVPDRTLPRPLDTDAAAFSADGRRMAAVAYGDLHILDVVTGEDRLLGPNLGLPVAVALSGDGRRALFAGHEGKIAVYDVGGGRSWNATAHTAEIVDAALSPDGSLAATASRDYSFRLWDVASGKRVAHASSRAIYALAFTADGRVASGSADGEVRLWDVAAGTATLLGKHAGAVYGVAAVGATVVSGGDDGTLRFWDDRPASLRAHAGGVYAVAASADGKRLVSGGADEKVRLWDPRKRRRLGAFDMSAPVAAVALAPDGSRGVAGDDEGAVRLFGVPSMSLRSRLPGADGLVLAAAFTPDGKTVLAAGEDDAVRRYRGRDAKVLVGHRATVTALACAGDRFGVSAAKDGTLVVWDLASGQPVDRADLHGSDDVPLALAAAPDGKTLAVGTARGVILIYAVTER